VTRRIYVRIPIIHLRLYPAWRSIYEEAHTIAVNGGGGLISMTRGVQPGQRLVVTNEGNDQTQECVVVSIAPYGSYVGLKFPTPTPQFWRDLELARSPLFETVTVCALVAVCASGHIQVGLIGRWLVSDEGLKYRL